MELAELVYALMRLDARVARAMVAQVLTDCVDWSQIEAPATLGGAELSVAAAVVELLSGYSRTSPPAWTRSVGASPYPVWLIAVENRPRLKARLLTESPAPLRNRRVYAPEDFLRTA